MLVADIIVLVMHGHTKVKFRNTVSNTELWTCHVVHSDVFYADMGLLCSDIHDNFNHIDKVYYNGLYSPVYNPDWLKYIGDIIM